MIMMRLCVDMVDNNGNISPKTRQKCNKENRKSLNVKDFRFLFRDSVGIRESAVFSRGIRCFTGSFGVG